MNTYIENAIALWRARDLATGPALLALTHEELHAVMAAMGLRPSGGGVWR